ncbi:PIN domain-containing protein [Arthrobacter sp. A5]|uniref:PIN domain-containing protein n=1 Tax=Arthrobacter sp. A5 TaxID=576926 RepID=UPI003DA7AC43
MMTEFLYNRRRDNPGASDSDIGRWRKVLTNSFPNAMISGYEIHPSLLKGKDKHDAHVVAAAAHGHVDYLVTANHKDFEEFSEQFEFAIFLPDDMLSLTAERRPDAILAAIKKQCSYWAARPGSKSLPAALIDAGAPDFAGYVKAQLAGLALSGLYNI